MTTKLALWFQRDHAFASSAPNCSRSSLNLAYRWFCRLGLDGDVPDHSTFSKNRHGRFRDCDLLRKLFETVVRRCMAEGLWSAARLPD
jgi:transposase